MHKFAPNGRKNERECAYMIRLDNVSKFYYSKGVIATGFSRVSLNFEMGEFVAITGESGSGKSTLLNVISGLDTYEEGEMYIDGLETSHYTEKDFESYRRRYIGNIFQNFNLVNSYTVYQNIELVLLLGGAKRSEVKEKVNKLIEQVGLSEYKRTKASKLSGGQKQRVAIARALAKDTPIIIADEPTGNLDSESAAGIIKLLSEIAKDKLVVIVTHNYDQVEPYVTRKIKMHDGKVIEDVKLKDFETPETSSSTDTKSIRLLPKLRLGVRNSFNIPMKFFLLVFVFLFIASSITTELSIFKHEEYENGVNGYNYFFHDLSPNRIIISKNNKTNFTDADYAKIEKLPNVKNIVKNDLTVDTMMSLTNYGNFYFNGQVVGLDKAEFDKVDYGRMPQNDKEVIISVSPDSYIASSKEIEKYLDLDVSILDDYSYGYSKNEDKMKLVGIHLQKGSNDNIWGEGSIYLTEAAMDSIQYRFNAEYSRTFITIDGKTKPAENPYYRDGEIVIMPSEVVKPGEAYCTDYMAGQFKDGKYIGKTFNISLKNLYFSNSFDAKITKQITRYNIKKTLGVNKEEYDYITNYVYVSAADFNRILNRPSYQSSVYVKDEHLISDTIKELKGMDLKVLPISDTVYQDGTAVIIRLLSVGVTFMLALALFFISYFVIRIILKSRNVYYSTIRMLGANSSVARDLLMIDLFVDASIACALSYGMFQLLIAKFPDKFVFEAIANYMGPVEYIAIYAIVLAISLLISIRYSKKLFKNSTMNTYKEEV